MKTPYSLLSKLMGKSSQPVRLMAKFAFVCLVLLTGATVARAADGVWTNDASSIWSATTNWLNGVVADGSGSTADFTLNNNNTNTVILDASHSRRRGVVWRRGRHHEQFLEAGRHERQHSDPGGRIIHRRRQQ